MTLISQRTALRCRKVSNTPAVIQQGGNRVGIHIQAHGTHTLTLPTVLPLSTEHKLSQSAFSTGRETGLFKSDDRTAWVAQLAKRLTLGFSSLLDLGVVRWGPTHIGPLAQHRVYLRLSHLPSAPPSK